MVCTAEVKKYRSKTPEDFFLIEDALIWNSFPSEIHMADRLHKFVRLVDQALTCTDLARSNTSASHSDIKGHLIV